MAQTLFAHIGLQKTGTSYLQHVFWASQAALADQGLDMVPPNKAATFHLMLDARERYRPGLDPAAAEGAVSRLPGQLRRARRPKALLTEESLASCTDAQVDRLMAACTEREVHVVVTVRDLARQIPSAWQQSLQAGNDKTLTHFIERLRRTEGTGHRSWKQQDVPAVLARWERHVPAERIHVVTVPPPGAAKTALLERFCTVLGIDSAPLSAEGTARNNRSLRAEQAEVLRQVNALLPAELKSRASYGRHGKRFLAVQVLGDDAGTPILLPSSYRDWCHDVSQRQIKQIRDGGYNVVGDLDDLIPRDDPFGPDEPSLDSDAVAKVAVRAVAAMLEDRMRHPDNSTEEAPAQSLLSRVRRRLGR